MPDEIQWEAERVRLERVYAWRDTTGVDALAWSWLRPEVHWLDFTIQRFLCSALAHQGWTPQLAAQRRLLEVGCGTGQVLRWMYDAGLRQLWGCEVLQRRAREAATITPFARIVQADMGRLPFPTGFFDCAAQVVAFSSCLDERLRQHAAREILRVLKDDGFLLWCDLKPGRTAVEYVRGLGRRDLLRLFPDTTIEVRSFGVNPQWLGALTSLLNQGLPRSLARRVPGLRDHAWAARRPTTKFPQVAAALLERCPGATTYLGAVIRKMPTR